VSPALLLALLAAAATAEVRPARVHPGDVVLITVSEATGAPSGALLGKPLRFWAAGPGRWQALGALAVEAKAGRQEVALLADGARVRATFEVQKPVFRSTRLSVPERFLEPPASVRPRIDADNVALRQAYAQPFSPPRYQGAMRRPRHGEVTGRYGDQRTYNGKVAGAHYGLDLDGAAGAPIEAAAAGQVVLARDCYMSGLTTVVWHGAGLYSVYLHQSKVEVQPGDEVAQGQRIGQVGSTGRSTGPHLHWGVKLDSLWVNPDSLVALALDGPPAEPPAPADPATAPVAPPPP
jgi:murein DD-endopeptidase MepM/ murein hydrolase activator NlpD